jgi:hypothetical protein
MTDTKTGAELEPVRGSKGTPFARRLFGAIGIGLGDRADDSDD